MDASAGWTPNDDGDTFELEDGRTLRFRVEPDQDSTIRDDEFYGAFSEYAFDYSDESGRQRPAGMNGNAEKLRCDRGSFVWWQPPADVPRGSEAFATFRANVSEILEFGYQTIGVEVLAGTDAYGRPIVVDAAWLGGVEPWSYGRLDQQYVSDLCAELGASAERAA